MLTPIKRYDRILFSLLFAELKFSGDRDLLWNVYSDSLLLIYGTRGTRMSETRTVLAGTRRPLPTGARRVRDVEP